ncbi:MAG: hypothetical protein V3R95_00985 [Dehalococcoidia bacterium]
MTASAAVLAMLALAASLLQLGAIPAFFLDGIAAPLLPVALIAAWAMLRGDGDAWPALLVAAVVLGVASQMRVGWFLLALLPTAAFSAAVVRRVATRRLAFVPATAAAGALAYLAVLALAAGSPAAVMVPREMFLAVAWTAAAAAIAGIALWLFHPRPHGLFE